MSKETYHVNEAKSNITWKLLCASILFVFGLVMTILFLKYLTFDSKMDDSICDFVTIGPVYQPNLKRSNYWRQIECDVKALCNIGHGVQIYSIGNLPVAKKLDDDESTLVSGESHKFNGLLEPVPSILISGHEIPNNLLMSVELQFGEELWSIVWEKTGSILKLWQIDAQNIDTLNIQPSTLLYETIERAVLQLLFAIIMDECYQASILQTEINCTDIAFISTMRADMVKPLLNSYMANETKCAQSEFHIDHFERVQLNENFDETVLNSFDSSNIINFEVKLCH